MATYGSRDKNPFQAPKDYLLNGVQTPSNLTGVKYYLLVDSTTGEITIKSPNVIGNTIGASGDRTVGTIPKDGIFNPTLGSATTNEVQYFSSAYAQKSVKNHAVITVIKAGLPESQAQQLIFPNTATSTSSSSTPTKPTEPTVPPYGGAADIIPVALENPNINATYQRDNFETGNNDLRYPLKLDQQFQDYIQFTMESNEGRSLSGTGTEGIFKGLGQRNKGTVIKGTVTLPIQPSITDSNGVEWGGANLDSKDAYLASLALGGITSDQGLGETAGNLLGRVFKDMKDAATGKDDNFRKAINLYLAQEAVGTQGLLSRASGAILNPNLELLFNGPSLRPFNFTFRLSPRSKDEAQNVKRIIRFFKEGMSVKTASNEVFLKSPNIFNIKYIASGSDKEHPSLNKIKKCALINCEVDYTPDGTYMTFNDEGKTMTSYQLTLRFSELEPIYSENYKDIPLNEIGY